VVVVVKTDGLIESFGFAVSECLPNRERFGTTGFSVVIIVEEVFVVVCFTDFVS
jgi:hypothetical protein